MLCPVMFTDYSNNGNGILQKCINVTIKKCIDAPLYLRLILC